MTNKNCLNCNKVLTDKFCSGCGQKADTHRINFKHFIFHDLLHGTFHLEKGILFTAKQALIRPGKAALEYISGKRVRYYNVFYLILLMIGLMIFFRHLDEIMYGSAAEVESETKHLNAASQKINNFFVEKRTWIIFLFVPLGAINSFILFRRKQLNLSEHAIISGMILLGILLLSVFINFYFNFNHLIGVDNVIASFIATYLVLFYVGFGYINAFRDDYTLPGITYRVLLFYVLIFLEIILLAYLLIGFMTDWKMGEITLSPF